MVSSVFGTSFAGSDLVLEVTLPLFYQDSSEPETEFEAALREKLEQEWRDHIESIL